MKKSDVETTAIVAQGEVSEAVSLFDNAKVDSAMRVCEVLAKSDLIPEHFQGKPGNCFIAVYRATKLGMDPFAFMEHTNVVNGKLGYDGQFVSALMNSSGIFEGPITFEYGGEVLQDKWCCAVGKIKTTGITVKSPKITYQMVLDNGWINEKSPVTRQWRTMFDLRASYRAVAYLGRLYAPQLMMGIKSDDELYDTASSIMSDNETAEPAKAAPPREAEATIVDEPVTEPVVDEPVGITGVEMMEAIKLRLESLSPELVAAVDPYFIGKKWIAPDQCVMDLPDNRIKYVYDNWDNFVAVLGKYAKKK